MNDDQLSDLKQFIDSRISQSETRLGAKINSVKKDLQELRNEMLDSFAGVGEAIDEIHKQPGESKAEFDKRLTKLEQQAV